MGAAATGGLAGEAGTASVAEQCGQRTILPTDPSGTRKGCRQPEQVMIVFMNGLAS
jgi:hypothetical protein